MGCEQLKAHRKLAHRRLGATEVGQLLELLLQVQRLQPHRGEALLSVSVRSAGVSRERLTAPRCPTLRSEAPGPVCLSQPSFSSTAGEKSVVLSNRAA